MIAPTLVLWYQQNKRDLPWRHTTNPYLIWISEIMLQQTKVETVIPYYIRFINRFPTVEDLANASLEEVYQHFQGLGYYSRAKNLHSAAIQIVNDYHGHFPTFAKELLKLKGIGPYTSCAISSISFLEPVSAIDGNAMRIITRTHLLLDNIALPATIKKIKTIADRLIQTVNPSDFNQAMMDLGATICTPKKPNCKICPIQKYCKAYQTNQQHLLPINIKKKYHQEIHFVTGIIIYQEKMMFIKKENGLLANLYHLIQYQVQTPDEFIQYFYQEYKLHLTLISKEKDVKHIFTHRIWHMHPYVFQLQEPTTNLYTKKQINNIPISTAHRKILDLYNQKH